MTRRARPPRPVAGAARTHGTSRPLPRAAGARGTPATPTDDGALDDIPMQLPNVREAVLLVLLAIVTLALALAWRA